MLTTLEELQDDTSYFVLICSTRRRRAYQEVLDQSSHPIVVVDTPEEALRQVVRRPPIAVIVDMITGMRAGASNTSLLVLYNLELAWPVVRGTTKQNEPISIVATSPQRTAPFVEALDSMVEGIDEWTAPPLHDATSDKRSSVERGCYLKARTDGIEEQSSSSALVAATWSPTIHDCPGYPARN